MFEGFCEEIATHLDSDLELLNICTNLSKRKKLRKGISISKSSISKFVQHQSMCIYNETEFKLEFELQARQFWNQWDEFGETIKNCWPRLEKANAMTFAERSGGPNYMQIIHITDVDVSSLLHKEAFSGFTIQQINRMCHPTTDNIEDDMNIL